MPPHGASSAHVEDKRTKKHSALPANSTLVPNKRVERDITVERDIRMRRAPIGCARPLGLGWREAEAAPDLRKRMSSQISRRAAAHQQDFLTAQQVLVPLQREPAFMRLLVSVCSCRERLCARC